MLAWATERQARVQLFEDPREAVAGADAVMTDVWVSMGDREPERRRRLLAPYQVDDALMEAAEPEALFMHCLPAHRGEEVAAEVIDGPALGRVRPGREPAARAKGHPHLVSRLMEWPERADER